MSKVYPLEGVSPGGVQTEVKRNSLLLDESQILTDQLTNKKVHNKAASSRNGSIYMESSYEPLPDIFEGGFEMVRGEKTRLKMPSYLDSKASV